MRLSTNLVGIWLAANFVLHNYAFAGKVSQIIKLPWSNATVAARDGSGNSFVTGFIPPAHPKDDSDRSDAFVAKISASGAIVFQTVFASSASDGISGLALARDGSILVIGGTGADFPVTPDAADKTFKNGAFFARLDIDGNITYASFLNSNSTKPGIFAPHGITSDATGAVYITGQGLFVSTPGALPAPSNADFGWFTIKLDVAGKLVFGTGLIGGFQIAVDSQGLIYIAGAFDATQPLPVTAGAFQPTAEANGCVSSGMIGFLCDDQYVAKLDSTASKQIYTTWLSGSLGASPSALMVDGDGNAILAGSTGSVDYPTTAAAFQSESLATNPPQDSTTFGPGGFTPPPPSTGFVSKLNASGTGLIFSTYVGGSNQDQITSMAIDSEGRMYLAGITSSPDFPGIEHVPQSCLPNYVFPVPLLTRLAADGSALSRTQLAFGVGVASALGLFLSGNILTDSTGQALAIANDVAGKVDLFSADPKLSCTLDAADLAQLSRIVPGQLLSLFSRDFGGIGPRVNPPENGFIPTTDSEGFEVTFNDVPAPILYLSPSQVNVQVPYEIAGQSRVEMKIAPLGVPETFDFIVDSEQPSVFLTSASYPVCRVSPARLLPVAINPDSSVNDCEHPANAGAVVSIFLNGLGLVGGHPVTGAIFKAPATRFSGTATATFDGDGGSPIATKPVPIFTVPGSINSVWTAKIDTRDVTTSSGIVKFNLTIDGIGVQGPFVLFVKAQKGGV